MTKFFKLLAAALIALFAVSALTACSSSNAIDMKSIAAVIDVRTPDEVATGHLHGSININIEGADFASEMNKLDRSKNYVVYCHSGRRAGMAVDWMKQNGFTGNLVNAGSVADAAVATGMVIQ
ncbi:MAG: rhodanese-like domain-containing protein [Rhodoluna sp.]